jgi:D-alanine transaminase
MTAYLNGCFLPLREARISPLGRPSAEQRARGVAALGVPDIHWGCCDLKTVALLPNVLARQFAADAGCTGTILFRDEVMRHGHG